MNVSKVWQLIIKGLVMVGAVALDRYRNKVSTRTCRSEPHVKLH
jgi:ribose transport system permease protein